MKHDAKQMSIRTRLLTGLIASLTLVLAAGCVGLYWSQRQMLRGEFDRRLEELAFAGMREFRPALSAATQPAEPEAPAGLVFIAIVEANTRKIDRAIPHDANIREAISSLPAAPEGPEFHTVTMPTGMEVRVLTRRLARPQPPGPFPQPGEGGPADRFRGPGRGTGMPPFEGGPTEGPSGPDRERRGPPRGFPGPDRFREPRPDRFLVAGADEAPLQASLRQWVLVLLAGGAAGELLVVGVVVLAVRRGLRPLRVLEGDIASIEHSDLARRIPTEGLPGEVRPMVGQLNALLWRLEEAFARERAFTASAAHEFRTPVAGIRTLIEVCLRRARSSEEYRSAMTQCLGAAVSLQEMIDALLNLASLDAGLKSPAGETVDVAALVRSQWARFEPAAVARGCQARLDMPDSLPFRTDPVMFEHVVSNLLCNAAEYVDAGGTIRISLTESSGLLRLAVANPAKSLDPSDAARLFDRFWRKDTARTDVAHHCGLGLAIVARCAEALRGKIKTTLQDGNLELAVELPPLGS